MFDWITGSMALGGTTVSLFLMVKSLMNEDKEAIHDLP